MNILTVDDDISISNLLKFILESENHNVTTTNNGNEAIEILRDTNDIDLVITDVIMPDKEGIETIREIKKHFDGIKIIVISGGGKLEANNYLSMAKTFGADLSIEKPFTKTDICDAIKILYP